MLGPIIYRRDAEGQVRTWQYEVDGHRWRSLSGRLGGAVVTSGWTHCEVAKSQTTPEAQAQFEADAELTKKLDRLYRRTVEELDGGDMMFAPMLAQEFKKADFSKKVFMQPKLDGMRCIATADGLFSRQGRRIEHMTHIEDFLAPFFAKYPEVVLDGELYNHDLASDFEKIISACKKQKAPSPDAHLIQYHIYDCFNWTDDSFLRRVIFLHQTLSSASEQDGSPVVLVNTTPVVDQQQLEIVRDAHLAQGYEGSMVRLDAPYEKGKRSKNLLKLKQFDDTEFEIVEVLEGDGNWAGYGKKLVIKLPDGRTCGCGVKGDQAFTRKLLEEAAGWVGKTVTVKHFGLTSDGYPRFPVAVKFWPEGKE